MPIISKLPRVLNHVSSVCVCERVSVWVCVCPNFPHDPCSFVVRGQEWNQRIRIPCTRPCIREVQRLGLFTNSQKPITQGSLKVGIFFRFCSSLFSDTSWGLQVVPPLQHNQRFSQRSITRLPGQFQVAEWCDEAVMFLQTASNNSEI